MCVCVCVCVCVVSIAWTARLACDVALAVVRVVSLPRALILVFCFPYQVAPYVVLDPKHTYSYLIKVRHDRPSGPYGGDVTDGAVQKGYRFPAPGCVLCAIR